MIREATHEDIEIIVDMLIAFQEEAACYSQVNPCRKSIGSSVKTLIDGKHATVAVVEKDGNIVGMTAAVAYPSWFNFSVMTGQEMFWYVRPEHRNGGVARVMFRWLEDWAQEKQLDTFTVASTGTLSVDRLEEFYKRRGYARWDVLYTKGLKNARVDH